MDNTIVNHTRSKIIQKGSQVPPGIPERSKFRKLVSSNIKKKKKKKKINTWKDLWERNMMKVIFNDKPIVYVMIVWNFAYKESRNRYWEHFVIDRYRFQRRIKEFEKLYNHVRHR